MDENSVLAEWLKKARHDVHDIVIAGELIGGRHGEAMQRPMTYQWVGPILSIRFAGTERLTVSDPNGIKLGIHSELLIARAFEARYGHHYYGRPQTNENWIEMIFRKRGSSVEIVTLGPLKAGARRISLPRGPFVQVV